MKKLILILLFVGAFSTYSKAQNSINSLDLKMDTIFKHPQSVKEPGYAVAVIKNGRVIFKKGYGLANLEDDIPITPATIFHLASVAKQFTGLAVSLLVQDGKISPDADIHQYLTEVPEFGKTITVRQLLHHTSGIRDCYESLVVAGWHWNDIFSFKDIMRMVASQKELNFDSGSEFSYSNTEYILLQAIVEKVTGKSFREWTDEHIFKPIGMNSAHFLDNYSRIVKNFAQPYDPGDNGFTRDLQQNSGMPLLTSLEDLCKWAIYFDKELDSKNPVYTRMTEEGILNNGSKVPYGFGLMIGQDRGLKTIFHTGAWGGYRAVIKNYPGKKLSIIILSNAGDNSVTNKKVSLVSDLFIKERFKSEAETTDKLKGAPTVKVDAELLKKYPGAYKWNQGAFTITVENGRLMAQYFGEAKFPAEAKTDSTFWVEAYGASIAFVRDADGNVNSLMFRSTEGKRIVPLSYSDTELTQYVGTYYSEELASEYKVSLKDNKLLIHHFRRGDYDLSSHPTNEDEFIGGIGRFRFIRNGDQVIGFKLSGKIPSGICASIRKYRKA